MGKCRQARQRTKVGRCGSAEPSPASAGWVGCVGPRGKGTTLSAVGASSAATGHAVEWVAAFERSEKVDAVDRTWVGSLRPTPGCPLRPPSSVLGLFRQFFSFCSLNRPEGTHCSHPFGAHPHECTICGFARPPCGHPFQPPCVSLRAKLPGSWTTSGLAAYAPAVALRQLLSFPRPSVLCPPTPGATRRPSSDFCHPSSGATCLPSSARYATRRHPSRPAGSVDLTTLVRRAAPTTSGSWSKPTRRA